MKTYKSVAFFVVCFCLFFCFFFPLDVFHKLRKKMAQKFVVNCLAKIETNEMLTNAKVILPGK